MRCGGSQGMTRMAAAVCLLIAACQRPAPHAPQPQSGQDAPYELADASDLAAVRDRFEGTPRADRGELRDSLAGEYLRVAEAALRRGDDDAAFDAFTKLISLFDRPAELSSPPPSLREAAPLATKIRATFAARGGDREAALALYVLAALEGGTAAESRRQELEAIFAYSDELAIAGHGPGAERSRPIEILEAVVAVAPVPAATARLIALYRERHQVIAAIIQSGDLSYEIIGAHGQSVLQTVWHIVRVHALAGQIEAAPAAIADIDGFGDDPELRAALIGAIAGGAVEAIALAKQFDKSEDDGRDLDAALAIIEWARARSKADPALLRAAGRTAAKNNQVELAIRLLEEGLSERPRDRAAAKELAELYEFRVTTLSLTGRPAAAASVLGQFEGLYSRAAKSWPDFTPDLANAYAAMGRGLLSLGDLSGAEEILSRSLGARTTLEALEHLGTLALRRDQFDLAAETFARALLLPAEDPSVRFNRAKLMRLAGESLLGAGRRDQAYGMFLRALEEWQALRSSETFQLRPPFAGESLVESGKLLWHIGKRDVALTAFAAAQDVAPSDANTYASIVSFLIVRDRYDAALDAYHRALGSAEVSDYFKVYMSLWLLAESRRAGVLVDPFVAEFLAGREGRLWYDELARFASGRVAEAAVESRATTRARRIELLYYRAVLGAPTATDAERQALLRDVVKSDMIMFFEYEMAKHWLAAGFATR